MRSACFRWSLLVSSVLAAGVSFAACSSTKAGGKADAGADAALDADEDVSIDVVSPPNDVAIYPEAPSLRAPDGCYLQSAPCTDDTTCCSAYCVDGGCTLMPKQM
jgi:hypothetical protein